MLKSELLKAIQSEISRHGLDTFPVRVDNGDRLIPLAVRHRIPKVWLVLVAIITLSLSAAQDSPKATTSQTKQEEPTLDAVLALRDPLLSGEVPTYYTPGFKGRAEGIRNFLAGERAFYKEKLGITVPLTVAVLDAKQCKRSIFLILMRSLRLPTFRHMWRSCLRTGPRISWECYRTSRRRTPPWCNR